MTLGSSEGCTTVASIQFAQSRCHLSEKTREGEGEDDERGRHVTARCDSGKGQRGIRRKERHEWRREPVLLREKEAKTKPALSLQEVQNYSSGREGRKSERRNGSADGVSVGMEGGMAQRETEQKGKRGR